MGTKYIISESQYNFILEQQNSFVMSLYNRIKNKPFVKKIESLYDPNLSKFIDNVVSNFPNLKNKKEILSKELEKGLQNPEEFLKRNQGGINKIESNQIQEQIAPIIILLNFLLVMILIVTIKKSSKFCVSNPEADQKLSALIGNRLNLYNDPEEQMLFGTIKIKNIVFNDCSTADARSKVIFNSEYVVECKSNPSRMDDTIYYSTKENVSTTKAGSRTVATTTVKRTDEKYNKQFTDAVQNLVGNFCKKPEADFAVNRQSSGTQIA
jgi:hypothetical protein